MPATYQVGYSRQKQYMNSDAPTGRRRHVVQQVLDEDGKPVLDEDNRPTWKLLCTGHPSTREYKGFEAAVNCRDCRTKIGCGTNQEGTK